MKFWEMTSSSVLNITSGPSKEVLSLVLFSRNKLKEPEVRVKTAEGETIKLDVISIEREDGSDESFNITAYAWLTLRRGIDDHGRKVVMYYRPDERVGKLRLYQK